MKVLVVKMSSLGDVVHTLPAVTDAAAAGHEIHWVVEEAFAPIAAAHPGVAEVMSIAWRRWRGRLIRSRREMARFYRKLRARDYDLILDAQGLYKSAAVVALARGRISAGLDRLSAREGGAAFFYDRRLTVGRDQHAVDRVRQLFAEALGEPVPVGLDFGLRVKTEGAVAVDLLLLHGTTWPSKLWPEAFWQQLAARAVSAGLDVALPFGDALEQARAERIAAASGARVLPRQPLYQLMTTLAAARWVVGVDSGLLHLAAALGVKTLGLYGSTDVDLTGARGTRVRNLAARFPCSPCLSRACTYQGPPQQWQGAAVQPPCFQSVDPDQVWQHIRQDAS